MGGKFWTFVGISVIVFLSFFAGMTQIDAGNRGVKTIWGEVQDKSLPEGLYFYNPISTDIHNLDCKVQKFSFKFETYTKDVQQAAIMASINYNVDTTKAHVLFKEVGMSFEETVIQPRVVQVIKDVIGKWEAGELVANREKATMQIETMLKTLLLENNIILQNVAIEDIAYSPEFESAIEAKQIATQDAIRAKNQTEQVREEAKQKLIDAESVAKSMEIRSKALSQNKSLVAYEAVQKWDGKLPVNIYGNAPIPFLNVK